MQSNHYTTANSFIYVQQQHEKQNPLQQHRTPYQLIKQKYQQNSNQQCIANKDPQKQLDNNNGQISPYDSSESQKLQQLSYCVNLLVKILKKLSVIMLLHNDGQQPIEKCFGKNSYRSIKQNQAVARNNPHLHPISLNIDDLIEQIAEAFDSCQKNSQSQISWPEVPYQFCQLLKVADDKFQLIKEQISAIYQHLNTDDQTYNLDINQQGLLKKLKLEYIRIIKYKHKQQNKQYFQDKKKLGDSHKSLKNEQKGEQKQFIEYLLSSIKQIKHMHHSQLQSYKVRIQRKQNQLIQSTMEVANLLNKNQQLCEDIAELQEQIRNYHKQIESKNDEIEKFRLAAQVSSGKYPQNVKSVANEMQYLKGYLKQLQPAVGCDDLIDRVEYDGPDGVVRRDKSGDRTSQAALMSVFSLLLDRNQKLISQLAVLAKSGCNCGEYGDGIHSQHSQTARKQYHKTKQLDYGDTPSIYAQQSSKVSHFE